MQKECILISSCTLTFLGVTVCSITKMSLKQCDMMWEQTWFHVWIAALLTNRRKKSRLNPHFFSQTKTNYFPQLPLNNWLLLFYLICVRIIITVIILDYFMHNKWTHTVCGVISMLGDVPRKGLRSPRDRIIKVISEKWGIQEEMGYLILIKCLKTLVFLYFVYFVY